MRPDVVFDRPRPGVYEVTRWAGAPCDRLWRNGAAGAVSGWNERGRSL